MVDICKVDLYVVYSYHPPSWSVERREKVNQRLAILTQIYSNSTLKRFTKFSIYFTVNTISTRGGGEIRMEIGGYPIGHKGSLVTAETANIKLRNCALGFLNQPGPAQSKTWRISQHDHYFQHKYRFSTISITGSQGRIMGFYSYLNDILQQIPK